MEQKFEGDEESHEKYGVIIMEERRRLFYEMMERAKELSKTLISQEKALSQEKHSDSDSVNPSLKERVAKLMPWPFNQNLPSLPLTRGKMRVTNALEVDDSEDSQALKEALDTKLKPDSSERIDKVTMKLPNGQTEKDYTPTLYEPNPTTAAWKPNIWKDNIDSRNYAWQFKRLWDFLRNFVTTQKTQTQTQSPDNNSKNVPPQPLNALPDYVVVNVGNHGHLTEQETVRIFRWMKWRNKMARDFELPRSSNNVDNYNKKKRRDFARSVISYPTRFVWMTTSMLRDEARSRRSSGAKYNTIKYKSTKENPEYRIRRWVLEEERKRFSESGYLIPSNSSQDSDSNSHYDSESDEKLESLLPFLDLRATSERAPLDGFYDMVHMKNQYVRNVTRELTGIIAEKFRSNLNTESDSDDDSQQISPAADSELLSKTDKLIALRKREVGWMKKRFEMQKT